MPGPPPNPNARRRNARTGPLKLPAEGRKGPPPPWPLRGRMAVGERELWAEVWSYPQAVAWEKQGTAPREVALYVRWSLLSEAPDPKAAVEARMMSDRLGLTPMALRRLMWEVVSDEVATARADRHAAPVAATGGARTRIRAVDPTG